MNFADRPQAGIATIGVIALALALAGCGRKAPLDPPPLAGVPPQAAAQQGTVVSGSEAEPSDKPIAPRRRVFLDWLID